jgi:hypothetical protein
MIDLPALYDCYVQFIHNIGGTPITYEQWLAVNPNLCAPRRDSDIEFDYAKEHDGDAQ